jgi:hypothetical protein
LKSKFIRQIQDIIDYADKFNVEGAILFLDFSKAFDSLEWEFMYLSLEKFGFQKSIIIFSILSLQCFKHPIHIPSVLFLFSIRPENEPNVSIIYYIKFLEEKKHSNGRKDYDS